MSQEAQNLKEETYKDIIKFYDIAEQFLDVVEDSDDDNPESLLDIIEPLIEQIEESVEVIADEYRRFAKDNVQPNDLTRQRIEEACGKLCVAIESCKSQI